MSKILHIPEKKIRKSDQFRLTLRLREELDFITEKKIRKSDQFRLMLRWREKLDKDNFFKDSLPGKTEVVVGVVGAKGDVISKLPSTLISLPWEMEETKRIGLPKLKKAIY